MKAAVVMEDEEPLLVLPRSVGSHQRPPSCGICCNTRCGAYFITALQMSMGLIAVLTACYQNPARLDAIADASPEDQKLGAIAYVVRRETIFLWGAIVVVISLITFRGIRTECHRLLNPTIIVQYFQLAITTLQTALTIVYWSFLAQRIRAYMMMVVGQIDTEIMDDDNIDEASREEWSDFEELIKDDASWANLNPKILYLVTMWHTIQILGIAWMIWTLMFHKKWLQHKYDGSSSRSYSGMIFRRS